MAGAVFESNLTAARTRGARFEVARRTDDAEIRRLLRENAMPGRISVSLEREPNYFADAGHPGEIKQTIIARDGGRLVCAGSCTIRQRFVNGTPQPVGYLAGLRLEARYAGRFDLVRRGYHFFRKLQENAPATFYFTSIAADNERARKFLERGVPGMPRYEYVGEFVTLLIPTGRRSRRKEALASQPPDAETMNPEATREILEFVNQHNRAFQFAPSWTREELDALQTLGLESSDFCIAQDPNQITGCGALWDQRNFKQTVIRNYTPRLAYGRPLLNAVGTVFRQPRLPSIGETLASAFVSHLATRTKGAEVLLDIISKLLSSARQRGIEFLTLGFAANDPRLATVRHHFSFHEYRSRIYVVCWPDLGGTVSELEDRILAPEVALL